MFTHETISQAVSHHSVHLRRTSTRLRNEYREKARLKKVIKIEAHKTTLPFFPSPLFW